MPMTAARGPTERRRRLADEAARLRADGKSVNEIKVALGVSRSYASELLVDPDGSYARARKEGYSRPCPVCGEPMSGSNGVNKGPKVCSNCVDQVKWTKETVVAAFRAFYQATGRAPAASDSIALTPSTRTALSPERIAEAERFADEIQKLPRAASVYACFGSWPAAVEAAGLERSRTGGVAHRGRNAPREWEPNENQRRVLAVVRRRGQASAREIRVALDGEMRASTVCRVLANLANIGQLDRAFLGYYTLPGVAPDREPPPRRPPDWRNPVPRTYLVLERIDESEAIWQVLDELEATSPTDAVEQAAKKPGSYYAILKSHWNPVQVAETKRLSVVRTAAAAR